MVFVSSLKTVVTSVNVFSSTGCQITLGWQMGTCMAVDYHFIDMRRTAITSCNTIYAWRMFTLIWPHLIHAEDWNGHKLRCKKRVSVEIPVTMKTFLKHKNDKNKKRYKVDKRDSC